ncbi:MAG: DUF3472 domain-containing protein [Gemmatimonadaceae bacterium]
MVWPPVWGWRVLLLSGALVLTAARPRLQSAPSTPLRIPANTAYTNPDPDAVRMVGNRPVAPFGEAGAQLVWYGRFATRGVLTASLELRVGSAAGRRVRLQMGGTARDATLPSDTGIVTVLVGDFPVPDSGFRALTLSMADGAPAPAVAVQALLLDGPATADAHFNLDPRRNAASVHLRYPTDSSWQITGFYSEVTAVDDPVNTYYMATGFARGYFGMQVNSETERRIIFSVWDAANGTSAKDRSTVDSANFTQLVEKGEGVEASVFGNEGTGGHSHLVYPWKTGSIQRFFVTSATKGTATVYSGYWFHPQQQQWMLIASFRAAKDSLGLRRLYAFSENFGGSTGHLRRKARYASQWVRLADGSWHELTTATFSHDPTGAANRLDRFMGVEMGGFFLSHGGFVPGFTASGTAFTRPASGKPPVIRLPQ